MQLSWSCGAHHNEPIEAEVPRLWPHRDGNQGAFVGAPETKRIHDGRIRRVPQGELRLLQVPATHSNLPDPEAKVFPPKPSKFEVCQSYLVKTQ